jgi:hypothetical protein
MCEGDKELRIGFLWENLRARGHLKDLGIDGKIILKWIFRSGKGIGLTAQDREK